MMRGIAESTVANLLLALFLISGCADDVAIVPDGGVDNTCAPGLKPVGPACIPIFDECKDDEVPMLGGGCKRVGVEPCDGGIIGPPLWTCLQVGKATASHCPVGWRVAVTGGCEPLLPPGRCSGPFLEVIGEAECKPIADCGTGMWGKIKVRKDTLYVDAGYTGHDSNGTAARPFKSIRDAVSQAAKGGHIAIAEGSYKENVVLNSDITIEGRCPQMVTITNLSSSVFATVSMFGENITIRGVTITGTEMGVLAASKKGVIERVVITGCSKHGIQVQGLLGDVASLYLKDSLVAKNTTAGVAVNDSILKTERAVIRDNIPQAGKKGSGFGIQVNSDARKATVDINDSVLTGNKYAGIITYGGIVRVLRSVIQYTAPHTLGAENGSGIETYADKFPTELALECLIPPSLLCN